MAITLLCIVAPQVGESSAVSSAQLRLRQQEAVALARGGETSAALELLAALREGAPHDPALLYDEIVVLSWAGRDRDVLQRAGALDTRGVPAYAANAVARSARNLGDLATALLWYQTAVTADATDADANAGLALTLADMGRLSEARATLDRLPAHVRHTAEVMLASAYVHAQGEQYLQAIADYDAVLAAEPALREALRGKALAYRALLLPEQALAIATAHPGVLSEEETAALQADVLAIELRLALASPPSDGNPYEHIDRALARYDTALAGELGQGPAASRLRQDRLVALLERARHAEAAAAYEALRAGGAELPAYVHSAASQAYLALRRPEEALAAIKEAERLAPQDMAIRAQRFYAEAEVENYAGAIAIADDMVKALPPVAQQDADRLSAEALAAMGRAYADDLDAAEKRLRDLVAAAPDNASLRHDLGNVYRWRGWADKAIGEYLQVLSKDPDWTAARTSLANAQMDRQEWRRAADELQELQRRAPDNGGVRNLARRWSLHERAALDVTARWGESSGDVFGTDQYEVDGWLYSPPFADNWRAFVRTFDSWGEFREGEIDRRRAAVGGEFRSGPWTTRAEINADRSGYDDSGFAARTDYRLSDRWQIGGLLEIDSYSTPLRADRAGIETDLAGLDIGFRRDESFAIGAGVRYQDFADGNERTGVFANGRWRAFTAPRYKLDLIGYLAASDAAQMDTPYFNPDRDFEIYAGLDNRWLMYRRYEQTLTHRLQLGTGVYDQKSYGSDGTWDLEYELVWAPTAAWELRGGWHRARRTYDGNPEYHSFWMLGVRGRL